MAIQHARICGACDRECPSWAHRCPACGSTAISYHMVLTPSGGTVSPIAESQKRRGRPRANSVVREPAPAGAHLRTSA